MSCCERPQPRESRKCFRKKANSNWQTEIIRAGLILSDFRCKYDEKTDQRNTLTASRLANNIDDEKLSPSDSLVSIKSHKSYQGSTMEVYINKFHESSV